MSGPTHRMRVTNARGLNVTIRNADSYADGAISVKASSALNPDKAKRLGGQLLSQTDLQAVVPDFRPKG